MVTPRPIKTALVFGGSGFIGTHLVRSLAGAGTMVVIADIAPPETLPKDASYEFCDVREPILIERESPFDVVYNLAAVHRTPGHDPYEYYETNVGGALNIVSWLEKRNEREVQFTSSIAVYGPSEELKSESTTPAPNSDYGRSKLLAEDIFRRWLDGDGKRRLIITRPAVVFGPGEGGNFVRLAGALKKRTFVYPGRKDVIKSCGYVTDLIDALAFASEQDEHYLLFNYCYPHRSTVEEICEAFHEVAGYRRPRTLSPALVRVSMMLLRLINPSNRGSISAARVTKLTASTNIAADELTKRGFEWQTDVESALRTWKQSPPLDAFV